MSKLHWANVEELAIAMLGLAEDADVVPDMRGE
jgi:hypothetical protein